MPYHMQGNCVYKVGTDKPLKCYDNPQDAHKFLAALEANVPEAKESSMSELQTFLKEQIDKFRKKSKRPSLSAFKAHGDYWHGEWTNNLEDRDAEFFSAKSIKDYVERVDFGLTPLPDLWVWHGGKAVKIGKAEQVAYTEKNGVIIASAIGKFDDSPRAQLAKQFFNDTKEIFGMSHGFTYPAARKQGRVYQSFNTFELSVLPIEAAANPYTTFDSKEYEMKAEKLELYKKVFGSDEADKIVSEMEGKAAKLSEIAEYKEFFSISDAVNGTEEKDKHNHGNEELESAMKTVVGDIIPEMGELAEMQLGMAKKAKEQSTLIQQLQIENKAMKKQIADIQAELKAKPKAASEADDTEVDDNSQEGMDLKKKLQDKEGDEEDTFWKNFIDPKIKVK